MAVFIKFTLLSVFLAISAVFAVTTNEEAVSAENLCLLETERNALYLSMPESTPKGSVLATLPVIGNSSGQRANIRLSLVRGREFVRLNPLSKQLVLKKAVDREQGTARVEAVVQCTPLPSEGNPRDNYFPLNISIFIAIIDVNDNAPKFPEGAQFSLRLPEELPPGTPIKLDFAATDRDQPGPNSHIRYRILQSENDDESDANDLLSLLSIPDPFRPELFVANRIDFEQLPNFTVLIEAEDQGVPKLRAFARLDVTVLDVDDQNPVFSSSMYRAHEVRGSELAIKPGPIRAWDGDVGFNETVVYSLVGEHAVNYAIDELTGAVRLLSDQLVPAELIVRASQLNRPERNATAFLLIQPENEKALDPSEEGPIFFIQKIPTNLAIGTELLRLDTLFANSTDGMKYELVGQNSQLAFIDRAAKSLKLARKLAVGEYDIELLAKPHFGQLSASVQRIHVHLVVFEPSQWAQQLPQFEQTHYEFEFELDSLRELPNSERQAEFIPIGQIRIKSSTPERREGENGGGELVEKSNSESSENQRKFVGLVSREEKQSNGNAVVFSLLNGDRFFNIDLESGILRLRNPLLNTNITIDKCDAKMPEHNKLFVMAEDAEGRRNFVECSVHLKQSNSIAASKVGNEAPFVLSTTHILGMVCFLLLLSNCATLSLWLGKRQFGNSLYDNLSYRYDSMEAKNRFALGKHSWMLNRCLEGDPTVKITRSPVLMPRSKEFFGIGTFLPPQNDKIGVATVMGNNSNNGTIGSNSAKEKPTK